MRAAVALLAAVLFVGCANVRLEPAVCAELDPTDPYDRPSWERLGCE